ncbi:MAG: TerB family tellurite resistance protein [Parvibaculum sp.]
MLEKIIKALKASTHPEAAPVSPETKRLAAAALLVEAARRDEHFDDNERSAIIRIVGSHFSLDAEEAKTLVDMATERQKLPYGESIFTRTIAESFTTDERIDVLKMLWEVALADGELKRVELAMIDQLAAEIGLDASASEAARKAVS